MSNKYKPPPEDKIHRETIRETEIFHENNPDISNPLEVIDISRLTPGHPLLKPFHPMEVKSIIKTFKNKAPGADTIRRHHAEHFPNILFVILTKIYNYCLATGYYPIKFKQGIMIFIGKPGKDLSHPKNYRPITLLNLIGKAFGKLINIRLVHHLESGDHLNPLQYGFRRGRGCESSLALMYEYVCRKLRSGDKHKISVISRDISGAFDRVWHQKLVVLFDKVDLHPLFTKLLANFLSNREIRVKIGNHMGPAFTPEAGVPQGAPDSPDIFNISTLPLEDLQPTPNSYMPWYADDLHMFIATQGNNIRRHRCHMEEALKKQDSFERTRGILTCPEKSIITSISHTNKRGPISYELGDETVKYNFLPRGKTTKILGLNISKFSWTTQHVDIIANKTNNIVSMLYAAREMAQAEKILLVKSLIIPSLSYPSVPLNTCPITSFCKLQAVLNRALKFSFGVRYPDVPTARSLLDRAKIKPMNQTIHKRASNIWHKLEQGIAGDKDTYRMIKGINLIKNNRNFPSSLKRAEKEEPPPINSWMDKSNARVKAFYNNNN